MSTQLIIVQIFNGIQYGMLLFLLSAGLTLVLGIMNFVNLVHGATYMIGAYIAAISFGSTHSYLLSALIAVAGTAAAALVAERMFFSRLYERPHLDHVLATFGLGMLINELARIIWGPMSRTIELPVGLSGTVEIAGATIPQFRLVIIYVGLVVAGSLIFLIHYTRLGILIRASASNAVMTGALGVNVRRLKAFVIAFGAGLAALAGLMAGPLGAVEPTMGDGILIMTLVVIVTGGIGSVRGAFYAALIIGVLDTLSRSVLPQILRMFFERTVAQAAGSGISSVFVYLLMAIVLIAKPQGLFPVRHG